VGILCYAKLIFYHLTNPKRKRTVPAEDLTLANPSVDNLNLDMPLDKMEDPQVAFWRDEYGMWVDELEAALSGEREFMFEDDITV
jgi:hypothetical protein